MAIFFMIAAMSSIRLSHQAGHDMLGLINTENLNRLRTATQLIQTTTDQTADQIQDDSRTLVSGLEGLRLDAAGLPRWQGEPLTAAQGRQALLETLRRGLSTAGESALIYISQGEGRWRRLAGITAEGKVLPEQEPVSQQTAAYLSALRDEGEGENLPLSRLSPEAEQWGITRLTSLTAPDSSTRLILAVGASTDAASSLLQTAASLFPFSDHQIAFLAVDRQGRPLCTYARPEQGTCQTLIAALRSSGGVPALAGEGDPYLMERALAGSTTTSEEGERTLFISVFPALDWIAVLAVNDEALLKTLNPLKSETFWILVQLSAASVMLIGLSGFMAWRIGEGIRRQLRELAEAAAAIAVGERRQALLYSGNDALGRFVQAFNRMAGAVAEREEALRSQIRTLEININQQELRGQVCSIVKDPSFDALSERARTMRARRQKWQGPDPEADPPS
ncbi:HAMP domain-containing protein [Cyanobium sp. PCC 7001]|uniref:HAMP domain-containing protein n=1 Tax=Cyanobium sp. PCC 7001 TaxID=180281 RepID=UPI0005BC7C30|nr:HAMP domain-containing protein [Cyanobium sp. PCC 7001]